MSDCKKLKDSKNEYPKKIKKLLEEYNKYEERKELDTSNYVLNIFEKYEEQLKKKYKEKIEKKYKELLEKKYEEECEKQIKEKQIKEKDKKKFKKKCIKELKKKYSKELVFKEIRRELLTTYSYLENFKKWFEMFYGEKSELFKKNGETNNEIVDAKLFEKNDGTNNEIVDAKLFEKNDGTNNEIVDAIFKYIYLDIMINDEELLVKLELPETFFNNIKEYKFKPIEIEFLNAILTCYYPKNKKQIEEWYNDQQNKELTYVEKTLLLQTVSLVYEQCIPMNFFNNEYFDNKELKEKLNIDNKELKEKLNIHYQSGCHNDFLDTEKDFLSKLARFVCYTINEGNDEVKEQIVYRIFELLGGREYFITKKEEKGDKYRLFELRGSSGTYIDNSSFNFTNIVRDDNKYPSLFGYIFNIPQKEHNDIDNILNIPQKEHNDIDNISNIFNILNAFNNMLNKKEVEDMDKASMLLPLFIENNTINNTKDDNNTLDKKEVEDKDKKTYKTLFDELVKKYNSNSQYDFKGIFNNICGKAKEYLPDDYLSKSSYYNETKKLKNNTVAKLPDENVKTKEEQDNQPIFKTENYSSKELELQYSDLSDKSSNKSEKIEEQSQNQNKLSNENIKTKGKTGNDYSSELPDSTASKEKEKTKNNNSSQESKLLSKDKETEKESQNQNKLSNENLKTKEEQKNQTTIAIENYSSQKLELPHSSLLDKSSNKGEKIKEQSQNQNELPNEDKETEKGSQTTEEQTDDLSKKSKRRLPNEPGVSPNEIKNKQSNNNKINFFKTLKYWRDKEKEVEESQRKIIEKK